MKELGVISEQDGVVTAVEAGGFHRVELDGGKHKVLARKSGPMVKNRIGIAVGDKVTSSSRLTISTAAESFLDSANHALL